MPDYIPEPDRAFDLYASERFVPYAAANAAELGLSPEDVTALETALGRWTSAYSSFNSAETAYRSAVEAKDSERSQLEKLLREIAGKVQGNPAVSDAAREAMGLTVRKRRRSPTPEPQTPPSIRRIDSSRRTLLRIFYGDPNSPETTRRPPGVHACEIRLQVGGAAPPDPNAMPLAALATRPPYRADFDPEDIGKPVYLALRWVNRRGKPGPWSQVYVSMVPA